MITILQPANCTESPPRLLFSVHKVSFLTLCDPLTNMAVKISIKKCLSWEHLVTAKVLTSRHFQLAPPSIFAAGNQNERRKIKICYLLKKKRKKKQAQGKQNLWTLFCPGLFLDDATVACGLSCLLRFGSWDRFLFLYQSDYTCRYQTNAENRRKKVLFFFCENILVALKIWVLTYLF